MSETVGTRGPYGEPGPDTPEWPQVWIGAPTCAEEAGIYWRWVLLNADPAPGVYTRWSEDCEIWYSDLGFTDPVEVARVPADAIQVAGVRL